MEKVAQELIEELVTPIRETKTKFQGRVMTLYVTGSGITSHLYKNVCYTLVPFWYHCIALSLLYIYGVIGLPYLILFRVYIQACGILQIAKVNDFLCGKE